MKKIQESQTKESLSSNYLNTAEIPFGYFLGKIIPGTKDDFQFVSVNWLFEQITQTVSDEIIGQSYSKCLSAHAFNRDWNTTISLAMATQAQNQADLYDHKLKKWIRLHIIPKNERYFDAFLQDISRDIVNKKEADRLKEKLFSMVVHDLRAPIMSTYNLLELIYQNSSYDKQTQDEILNEVIKSTKGAFYLIENMLHWALCQKDQLIIKKEYININDIIAENIKLFSNLIKQKQLRISYPMAEEVYAFADENMCNLILRNIFLNAIKFSFVGGKIEFRIYSSGNQIIVDIEDEGIGIDKSHIPLIFSPDKYFSTKGTKNEKGYGLGLSLCNELLHLNNGSLQIESSLGEGSRFSVRLPRQEDK